MGVDIGLSDEFYVRYYDKNIFNLTAQSRDHELPAILCEKGNLKVYDHQALL